MAALSQLSAPRHVFPGAGGRGGEGLHPEAHLAHEVIYPFGASFPRGLPTGQQEGCGARAGAGRAAELTAALTHERLTPSMLPSPPGCLRESIALFSASEGRDPIAGRGLRVGGMARAHTTPSTS